MRSLPSPQAVIPAAVLLVAATFAVFWPGLSGGFIFDDFPNLVRESAWRVTSLQADQWVRALDSGISSAAGRPLAIASFAVNHLLTGPVPFWLKFTNVLLHALNGLLMFGLCKTLFDHLPERGAKPGQLAACLLALAWLLHPLQASTVLYIVQRMEIGAATGVLVALTCYLRARTLQLRGAPAWHWLALSVLATAVGFGFKESALLAPGFAFLFELTLLHFRGHNGRRSTPWVAFYAAGACIALIAYIAIALPYLTSDTAYGSRDFSLQERLWTQIPVLGTYIGQIVLPLPDGMTFYYDNFPISHNLLNPRSTLFSALGLVGLVSVAWFSRHRWPLVPLGIGWFLLAHFLTSNVVPLELAFEHRNYLALLGILLALVQPLRALVERLNPDARVVIALVPVLCLAWLCALQAATWGNDMRLAWTLENRNPSSPRASYALGQQFARAAQGDANSPAWSLARQQFVQAATLPGNASLALQAVIMLDAQAGRDVPAAIWVRFRESLTSAPLPVESVGALHAVSTCRIEGRCQLDDRQLMRTFLAVLARNPRHAVAHTLYANFAWNVLDDRELAIAMQREAVRLAPARADLRKGLLAFESAEGARRLQPAPGGTGGADEATDGRTR